MPVLACTFKSLTNNRRLQGFLVLSVLLTFAITSTIIGTAIWLLGSTQFFQTGWLEWIADLAGGLGAFIIGLIIIPALMPLIASIFEGPMLRALEKEGTAEDLTADSGFIGDIAEDVRFLFTALGLNILCLPLYFIPGLNLAVYYILNGYLLGREFFTTVESNYTSKKVARQTFKAHKIRLFGYGAVLAFMATLPVINWFLPVFALTMMFHARKAIGGNSTT